MKKPSNECRLMYYYGCRLIIFILNGQRNVKIIRCLSTHNRFLYRQYNIVALIIVPRANNTRKRNISFRIYSTPTRRRRGARAAADIYNSLCNETTTKILFDKQYTVIYCNNTRRRHIYIYIYSLYCCRKVN